MTSEQFRDRLSARAGRAGISIPPDSQEQLEAYFRVLTRWNAKINLTALPLQRPTDQTFDRLLIEPLVAAQYVSDSARLWFDLGSGGGSPAIPFKIAHPQTKLTMVESRTRKAAFLREAVRLVGLADALVVGERFESVAEAGDHPADLVTVRAVKSDHALFSALHRLLSPHGRAFLFHSSGAGPKTHSGFDTVEVVRLGTGSASQLSILKPVFHVEQSG